MLQIQLASSCSFSCIYLLYQLYISNITVHVMSEDNIATPGNESHQLQAPGPGFDCTGIIERVIEQTSGKHANTMATIANTMEN